MLSDFYILQTTARPNTSLEQIHAKVHRARDFRLCPEFLYGLAIALPAFLPFL